MQKPNPRWSVRLNLVVSCCWMCLLWSDPAWADASEDRLEAALSAYALGLESADRDTRVQRFSEAERLFRSVLKPQQASAPLWTNLGNAALQAEHPGHAILAYRRALIIDPGYTRAKQNLEHARDRIPDWVPTPSSRGLIDTFFFWHGTLPRSTRATAAALCFAGLCLLLSASLGFRVPALRYPAGLLAVAWLALLASVLLDPIRYADREGVIVVPEAQARAADSVNAPLRFGQSLPSGAEVRILEDRGGWYHIELHNGRDAWLSSSQVERIGEPQS